ncbi:MAG: hypothetical protein A3J07_04930 [Candidatus Doudnabacteria bacterium RIFCSPLOWO2_02_FULL_49_13]|uniref:RDD domain-containing protein n=1 Tax=Candidatus Doudnabacteria bacterium RIFCSPHIGHO2_12_FULL_48_16 TaxID=1817838 RepID=A0A1F5PKL5_9BACT|nr:MAG: hypothetical protein A3B77_04570 [Candidatus Doudnabacteria bacterium RIFCSPHIGHO2_02_FULL_49_24]OGE88164.1 MAG: hypothetical protein A2760_02220 [Candidatus Doudnabacteria bacterium RIFCSPHIGHO2_01_FULL_50_67]OGE90473.1 MAG: hypothetical protein A3E29_05000 [Candidatus Doudnabacteria bacterium RIFCSPHIGHO2_12_FULL_48_16]OGE96535.1 MAG: hypothetical protein A2990_03445 [Candidatus Doudnabacteria bacterium RIFCSPLOWO2_01_FULL_49_40]OGF02709.1 MAG: hypothetical protein A3J07_04930 [Candid
MEPVPTPSSFNHVPTPSLKIASSSKRLANLILDGIFFRVIVFIIMSFLSAVGNLDDNFFVIQTVWTSLASYFAYYVIMEVSCGRTLAKFITRTKVVMADGSSPDLMHLLGRTAVRFIPFEAFSFFGSRPVGWHDRFSGTRVIES